MNSHITPEEQEFFEQTRGLELTAKKKFKHMDLGKTPTQPVHCWKCGDDLTKVPRAKLFHDHFYCPKCGETTNMLITLRRKTQ